MLNLAIVIVSYNTCELLRACLSSVYRSAALSADHMTVAVIVVDNASSDGSAEMVRIHFPQVQLVASEENLGFTGGNNHALRLLGFDSGGETLSSLQSPVSDPNVLLLLNPDTEIVDDALWQMASFLSSTPNAGACGANLRYGDGRFQHGAFRFPNLFQVALDFFPLSGVPGAARLHNSAANGRYPVACWQGSIPFPVDFVLGATLMVKAEAIRNVGLLDDGYFMYCEEMDWCLRIQDAGYQIFALPTARVIHHEGQSSKQVRWHSFERLWRSRLRFYEKFSARYPAWNRQLIHWLIQIGLYARSRSAHRRFAHGKLDGAQLAEELTAYEHVRTMVDQS